MKAESGTRRHVTVIGAGIVGTACALNLQRDGHAVTVVDRNPPGEGCSQGNAGILATASFIPMSVPGIAWKAPFLLLDPLGPLSLRWSYVPRVAPWLVRFLINSTPRRVGAIADALSPLLAASVEVHARLAAGTGAEKWITPSPYVHVFESGSAFAVDAPIREMRRARGARFDVLDGAALRQLVPALSPRFRHGVRLYDHGYTADPMRLVKALAEHLVRRGATVLRREVLDLDVGAEGPTALLTDAGRLDVDVLVIAAGAWSHRLAARLGDRLPLEAERGYHVTIRNPGISVPFPIASATGKFVATPMEPGLRLAGLAEFGGLEAPPDPRRARSLLIHAGRMFPGIDTSDHDTWMGHRPALPDSLPVIGRAPNFASVYYAFGHQHVGLTAGPRTGEVIADLVAGRSPDIDLAPFSAQRFG
jgi:D-amino-acid dehydrogenase